VSLALPPVGWQRTVVQPWQMTTVWAWENTVVMVKQPGHFTSMKKDRGAGTRVYDAVSINYRTLDSNDSFKTYLELVLAGLSGRAGVDEINGENLENRSVSILSLSASNTISPLHSAHARCPISIVL